MRTVSNSSPVRTIDVSRGADGVFRDPEGARALQRGHKNALRWPALASACTLVVLAACASLGDAPVQLMTGNTFETMGELMAHYGIPKL